ncbi:MAG: hypothetical protein ACXW3E_09620 [Thermoanaerobaculia bacterium]
MKTWKIIAGGAATAVGAYLALRPWHVRWGATDEEIAASLPLDDVVPDPTYVTNRGVTIEATLENIWPWLVQMGESPRGGFYTYTWIERLLGMEVSNAEVILPQFQELQPGDRIDHAGNLIVRAIEANHHIVLGPPVGTPTGDATWTIVLTRRDDGTTRLLSRVRARLAATPRGAFWLALLDPGQFVMERRWLLGVKERAERAVKEEGLKAPKPETVTA